MASLINFKDQQAQRDLVVHKAWVVLKDPEVFKVLVALRSLSMTTLISMGGMTGLRSRRLRM